MKTTFKIIFWLVILALLGSLIYQNQDYFMTKTVLTLDLKKENWVWSIPGLENIYFFGICFILGLLFAGFKGLMTKWGLKRIVKARDKEIETLQEKVTQLKIELEVFQHDPYISKELEKQTMAMGSLPDIPPEALPANDPDIDRDIREEKKADAAQ